MLEIADSHGEGQLSPVFTRIAAEITLLSSILVSYDCASKSEGDSGSNSSFFENPRIAVLREVWPSISHAANSFAYDQVMRRVSFLFWLTATLNQHALSNLRPFFRKYQLHSGISSLRASPRR